MSARFLVDTEPTTTTTLEVPAFPWVRCDAGRFILEEGVIEGNYVSLHFSAMGRPGSRERLWAKYQQTRTVIDRALFAAFVLEVDGQLLRDHWELDAWETRATAEGEELRVVLRETEWPVRVTVCTRLDDTDFVERWLEIENTGTAPLAISRLAPWCGLLFTPGDLAMLPPASTGYALGRYRHMTWAMEGEFAWQALPEGTCHETTRRLNKFAPRYYLVRNEETAEIAVIDYEYSGGTDMAFTHVARPSSQRCLHAQAGLADHAPQRVLAPGESVASPRVHLSMQYGDEDTCANALFDHLRRAALPARPWPEPHPVGYHYGGYLNPVWIATTPEIIHKEIDQAALLGAELFTVDAGWNVPAGKSYVEVFGDWWESPTLRGQLGACFDYARTKGLGAALWAPIEAVGSSSRVLAEHPEWLLRDGPRPAMMLDLAQPAVEEYVYGTISGLIERYRLACFRIDGGVEHFATWDAPHGRYRESRAWRYYEALYRIFERVRAAYPQTALENCWGGGGRIDLGMMRRFHWVQYSDNWHPEEQLRILYGLTLCLPPEQCLSFIGAINENPVDLDFCIRAGLFGQFCIAGAAPSAAKMNADALARWQHAVQLYKTAVRPWLAGARVYHHTPVQEFSRAGDWLALEYVAADRSAALAGIFRLGESRTETYTFLPRGLDPGRRYEILFDTAGARVTATGLQLSTTGLPVRLPGRMMSELLVIRAGA